MNFTWEIVCPDGCVRHLPYANKGDADCDASVCDERGCQLYSEPTDLERRLPPCQGKFHTVRLAGMS